MTEENLVIRVATPDDVHDIMELVIMAGHENGFVDMNKVKMLETIYPAICRDNGVCGIISAPNGKPEGVIILKIGEMWYSDQTVLEEKLIFIHPEYRNAKGGRARKLCEFAKHVADTLAIPLIIGVLSNSRTEAKVRMYERQFGTPSGAFFLYRAKTGDYARTEH